MLDKRSSCGTLLPSNVRRHGSWWLHPPGTMIIDRQCKNILYYRLFLIIVILLKTFRSLEIQAEYKFVKKAIMVFFFSITTPLGIAIGIAMSSNYKENSPKALITVGLLNGSSAGLLIYMALVDLLAADFMSRRMQGSIKLQLKSYVAVFLGAGGMSLMAKWA